MPCTPDPPVHTSALAYNLTENINSGAQDCEAKNGPPHVWHRGEETKSGHQIPGPNFKYFFDTRVGFSPLLGRKGQWARFFIQAPNHGYKLEGGGRHLAVNSARVANRKGMVRT